MSYELIQRVGETQDGTGAADHDLPYTFGRSPRSTATYPFSTRQYARLLVLRSRVRDDLGSEPLND
jgi:hypothetical protein